MLPSKRATIAILVAVLAGAYALISSAIFPGYVSDFDQLWWAAHAVRDGQDAYAAVAARHASTAGVDWGLVYPLSAVLVALPFSFLPLVAARATIDAVGAGCLTYLVLGRGVYLFPVLLSGAFRSALSLVQIAPLVACAALSPWFGWVIAYKPNAGLAVLAAAPSRRWIVISCALSTALVLAALAVDPSWPMRWVEAVRANPHTRSMLVRPGGALLLLAAIRWRRPEARWLLATSLIPATASINAALPLLVLTPATFREALGLAILSHLVEFWGLWRAGSAYETIETSMAIAMLWGLYVPALAMIVRRPNSGEVPDWLERAATWLPRWARGTPG
jgi:hypothetical protein